VAAPDKPCARCPFLRKALPGYLGDDTPENFMATTMSDYPMPCHLTINYTDSEWKEKWENGEAGEQCAGAAIFFANMNKISRDSKRLRKAKDPMKVFANPIEFLAHHNKWRTR
jgi:hypothetical protein